MLPVNPGGHAAYQNFVVTNLRKYYPNPDAFSQATWNVIERFWNLDLSYTDELLRSKYSVFGILSFLIFLPICGPLKRKRSKSLFVKEQKQILSIRFLLISYWDSWTPHLLC